MMTPPRLDQAEALHRAGDLVGAEALYRDVLRSDPGEARAWFLLGAVCQATGRPEEAVAAFRRALDLWPEHAPTWNLLGVALAGQGRAKEAEACFLRVLRIDPGHAEAARNLERARRSQGVGGPLSFEACCRRAYEHCDRGAFAEAEAWFRRALAIRPDSADALNDLGKTLVLLSRPDEGLHSFRRAVAVDPDHARAHLNLGATLFDLGRSEEAEPVSRRALQLDPDNPSAHNNLGLVLNQLGRLSEAERSFADGLRLAPDHPELHANLGNVLVLQGRADEAQAHYRRALESKPASRSAHSNWLLSRQCLPGVTPAGLAQGHRDWERRHASAFRSAWRPFTNVPDPDRPLRLGFVSADFRRHPVGFFLIRAFEAMRGLDCRTYGYDTGSEGDDLNGRFAASASAWRPSRHLSDDELAEQIRADRIDLLFDLAGHTSKNRLLVFARKPAPIQLTWLGYAGTTGLTAIDYLIADRHQVPEGMDHHYAERIIRLPDGYACYDPPAYAPEPGPPPSSSAGHVTFGCFNSPAKLGPGVVAAWARILARLPSSRLLLKYKGLDDPEVSRRFLDLFASQGIDPGRIELEGWAPNAGMLAAYRRVDIALDPFPYSGGLTTCEALWMGVPVVTLPGETFAGRHARSHLSAAGLAGTVARDLDHYAEIALGLAGDPGRLAELRASLRPRMAASPLCDGPRLAGNLLRALRACWRVWCRGRNHR